MVLYRLYWFCEEEDEEEEGWVFFKNLRGNI